MKIYINSELTIENGDVKVTIEEFLRQLPHVLKGEFVYINFDHQNETSNTNIDEIELIKSFSNLNFIYASLYNIDSRKIPSIISSSEFEEMIKKLKEDELEIIQRKMNIVRMKRKAVNEYRDELILNYYSKKIRVCS